MLEYAVLVVLILGLVAAMIQWAVQSRDRPSTCEKWKPPLGIYTGMAGQGLK